MIVVANPIRTSQSQDKLCSFFCISAKGPAIITFHLNSGFQLHHEAMLRNRRMPRHNSSVSAQPRWAGCCWGDERVSGKHNTQQYNTKQARANICESTRDFIVARVHLSLLCLIYDEIWRVHTGRGFPSINTTVKVSRSLPPYDYSCPLPPLLSSHVGRILMASFEPDDHLLYAPWSSCYLKGTHTRRNLYSVRKRIRVITFSYK